MSIPRRIRRRVPNLVPIGTVQQFDSFPRHLNLWPPKTPRNAPWDIQGRLLNSVCPFLDESADVNQSWCQSLQPAMTASQNFWIFYPLKPPKCPLVSRGAIFLEYIYSQMNLHICAIFGPNRSSRLVAFTKFVLILVRLLAALRADSRKNMPKTIFIHRKIIIPAQTCWHKRH